MLIHARCGHCQTIAEMSKVNLGKLVVCPACRGEFVAQEHEDADNRAIGLAEEEADVQSAANVVIVGALVAKHSLTLPPPPKEDWNLAGNEDDGILPGERFPRFRPRRKELEPFLDLEHSDDDKAIFLVAGLVALAVLGAIFCVLLLILCFVE
jgi:hypothetical protein